MRELNASIRAIPLPTRMRHLPISATGYPVPWFVNWLDGEPDFRVVGPGRIGRAIRADLCWLCGETLGKFKAFTIGPMCAVNRVSSEPPSHRECAEYAVQACPFLTRPRMRRNEKDVPEEAEEPAGIGLKRNPGVALVWITKSYKLFKPTNGGVLFEIGPPETIRFYAEGRRATREEIMASIDSGLPHLRQIAELQGPDAILALEHQVRTAMTLIDAVAA